MLAGLVGAALAASTDFHEPASSPEATGIGPVSVAAAKLDGDSTVDLAVANTSSGDVTILLNNGSADFTVPAASPELAGTFPTALTAADLDGDGHKDIAVTNQASDDVTILLNNGSGDFTEPASSPEAAGTFPQGITAADLNGDGYPDLAVANQGSNDVTILHNKKGTGDFVEPSTSPEAAGVRPFAVVAADFDRDGRTDLATANHDSDTSTILRNRGSFDFIEPVTSPEGAGDGPYALTAARLNGDEAPDLAIVDDGSSKLTILKNR